MSNVTTVSNQVTAEAALWKSRVNTAGGGLEWNSMAIANTLVRRLRAKSYYSKIKYMLPLLGRGINAARVPLIDRLNVGAATNNNFVDADFNQATGLVGNGSTKRFDCLFIASSLGSSNNGGMGYWSLNSGATGGWLIGSHTADIFGINLGSSEVAYWGNATNQINTGNPSTTSHYYSQRNSSNLTLYKSGGQIAQTAGATVIADINANINFMAIDASFFTNGTGGLGYFTDGTLTGDEIYDLHLTLSSSLMGPTGRI